MGNNYIRITGNSQGETSMSLSILDGIEGLYASPFEPSYERIFNRLEFYNSWEYLLLDYIVGVKDPFHYSYLNPSGIKCNTSKKPKSISHLRTKLNNINN